MEKLFTMIGLLAVMLSCAVMAQDNQVVFRQDFDGPDFRDGMMPLTGTATDGSKWLLKPAPHMNLVEAEGSNALEIHRAENFASAEFLLKEPLLDGADYRISFKVILKSHGRIYLHLRDADNQVLGGVMLKEMRNPSAYSALMLWQAVATGNNLVAGTWKVDIVADHGNGEYTMTLTGQNGEVISCLPAPLLCNTGLARLVFGNIPPDGDNAIIDDLLIECEPRRSVKNRKDLTTVGKVAVKGNEVNILLDTQSTFNTIRVYGEAENPFVAEANNSMGHRVDLGAVPAQSGAEFRQLDFKPETGQQLRLVFQSALRSSPQVAVYEEGAFNHNQADKDFQDKVIAEFVCPVFQEKTGTAQLQLVNSTSTSIPVKVTLAERFSGKVVLPARKYVLVPGDNFIDFDLATLPVGHFIATVSDATDEKSPVAGSLRRLLRREILPEVKPEAGKDFSGQIMTFPDDFYLSEKQDLQFVSATAEVHQITQPQVVPGNTYQKATSIGVTPEGKLEVFITTLDNKFSKSSAKRLRATAAIDELDNWEVGIADGAARPSPNPHPILEKDNRLDNQPKPGPDGKIHYRFYDPEHDGKVDVRQVTFLWINFHDANQIGYETYDFGGYVPERRTTWPIWYKSPGEALVLSRRPLYTDQRGGGEFEDETDSNDNNGSTWLSADGKYICKAACNTMRYLPPRGVTYDNLARAVRIVRVLRTADGINYERFTMAVPFPDDPPATQHYSINTGRLVNGGGLMAGLVYNYNAYEQRIWLELCYSHDGYSWKRLHGNKPFVDNGPHGSLTAGYVAANMENAVEIGDKVYCVTDYVSDAYHILAELMWGRSDSNALTEDILRHHVLPRAEKWPLRHRFADFKEMAEYASNTSFTVALLAWRKDGLFSAQPLAGKTATFTTIPIRAGKTLAANLQVAPGGCAEFELLDRDGKALPGYSRKIGAVDSTGQALFDNLPEGEFRIRVKLDQATLFALLF